MKASFYALLFLCLFACQNSTDTTAPPAESSPTEGPKTEAPAPKEENYTPDTKLKVAVRKEIGGFMADKIELNGKTANITYFGDFDTYKAANSTSTLAVETFDAYWGSASKLEKLMVLLPVRIMVAVEQVEEVHVLVPHQGKTYDLKINKSDIEEFTGESFELLKKNVRDNYLDIYVRNAENRKKIFGKYVKVS